MILGHMKRCFGRKNAPIRDCDSQQAGTEPTIQAQNTFALDDIDDGLIGRLKRNGKSDEHAYRRMKRR